MVAVDYVVKETHNLYISVDFHLRNISERNILKTVNMSGCGYVRPYNPSVRVGNWNEDIQLEEDTLKDFLDKRDRGELLIQKTAGLKEVALNPVELSISRTGKVHFGDTVLLMNPAPADKNRGNTAVAMLHNIHYSGECGATLTTDTSPTRRTALVVTSLDGTPKGEELRYNQSFYMKTADSDMYLFSDRATFMRSAKKSRQNEVSFAKEPSHLTEWKILPFNPKFRMELEWTPVHANEKIIFTHVKTNKNLCLEMDYKIRTPFGVENEITTNTVTDSHKAETDVNHWVVVTRLPGDTHNFLPQNQAKLEEKRLEREQEGCEEANNRLDPDPQRWQQKDTHCRDDKLC